MNQITGHQLWIGHAGDGRDSRGILEHRIRAVVQLAVEEPVIQAPRELIYCRFPLVDSTGNRAALPRLAIAAVTALIEAKTPALVCCSGGMSRSPALVAAALARVDGADLHDCLRAVTESHPSDVSPGLWGDICRAVDQA